MKQVSAVINLDFTTDDDRNLKTPREMKFHIQAIVNTAVENYLESIKVNENEVHVISIDDLYIEEYEE